MRSNCGSMLSRAFRDPTVGHTSRSGQARTHTEIFGGTSAKLKMAIFFRQSLRLYGFEANHFCSSNAV